MSNNPTATLVRPASVRFCLAHSPKNKTLICTRIDKHDGHCCDEIERKAWDTRGKTMVCVRNDYDHSAEKGLITS